MDFLQAIDGLMDFFPGVYRLTSLSVTSRANWLPTCVLKILDTH